MYTTMFRLPRTRNPLLRAVSAIVGVLILAALVVFGFFAALALVTVGAVIWAARQFTRPSATPAAAANTRQPPQQPAGVIEGEFTVVRDRSTTQR
jgi:amino acid transporter